MIRKLKKYQEKEKERSLTAVTSCVFNQRIIENKKEDIKKYQKKEKN